MDRSVKIDPTVSVPFLCVFDCVTASFIEKGRVGRGGKLLHGGKISVVMQKVKF